MKNNSHWYQINKPCPSKLCVQFFHENNNRGKFVWLKINNKQTSYLWILAKNSFDRHIHIYSRMQSKWYNQRNSIFAFNVVHIHMIINMNNNITCGDRLMSRQRHFYLFEFSQYIDFVSKLFYHMLKDILCIYIKVIW